MDSRNIHCIQWSVSLHRPSGQVQALTLPACTARFEPPSGHQLAMPTFFVVLIYPSLGIVTTASLHIIHCLFVEFCEEAWNSSSFFVSDLFILNSRGRAVWPGWRRPWISASGRGTHCCSDISFSSALPILLNFVLIYFLSLILGQSFASFIRMTPQIIRISKGLLHIRTQDAKLFISKSGLD
jgi:hypothetical protein